MEACTCFKGIGYAGVPGYYCVCRWLRRGKLGGMKDYEVEGGKGEWRVILFFGTGRRSLRGGGLGAWRRAVATCVQLERRLFEGFSVRMVSVLDVHLAVILLMSPPHASRHPSPSHPNPPTQPSTTQQPQPHSPTRPPTPTPSKHPPRQPPPPPLLPLPPQAP